MRGPSRALIALLACATWAEAVAPPVVPWERAGEHVGQLVTVEGRVAAAQATPDTCVLEFAPDDPNGFRVVVVLPLLARRDPNMAERYRGARVRATGRVARFRGRSEMVLQRDDQIEVVEPPEGTDAAPAAALAPPPTAPPPTVPPRREAAIPREAPAREEAPVSRPAPAPPAAGAPVPSPPAASPAATAPVPSPPPAPPAAAPRISPPPPASVTEAAPPSSPPRSPPPSAAPVLAQGQTCDGARARWREAADSASAWAARLSRCLAAAAPCRAERSALTPALAALDAADQELGAACP